MKCAADYLGHIKALITLNGQVVHWRIVREEAQSDVGLLRYQLSLRDGSLLEMFERFQVVGGRVQVTKYSFPWQDAKGQLRQRWDNAAHHSEVPTSPHHLHEGAESVVLPHSPVSAEEVLAILVEDSVE